MDNAPTPAVHVPGDMIHNERINLLATALNNLGVGSIIAGLVAPIVNSHFSIGVAVWSSVGIGLICLAQLILGRLH
jgi:hypothetical protein